MLKISIITVCYNSERYIEQTIQSVINQTYPNIEYIIVDGLSKDRTPEIIEKYRDKISIYIQGKDKNMYDAINKGMKASTGDFIEILNSDDLLYDKNTIDNVAKAIAKDNGSHEIYYGNNCKFYQTKGIYKKQYTIQTSFKKLLASKKLTFMGHGSVFISRKVYNTIGEYNCDNYRAAADFDFILRCLAKFDCKHIDVVIQCFRDHEASITSSGQIGTENNEVLLSNGYNKIQPLTMNMHFYMGWGHYIFANLFSELKYRLMK